ncbi:terpene synthase family protein [Streptomyces vinaceus]|uniref:terpene synthase family protein n=1 Tax=Streptomyces vinaceus TaxID=1960 RepID=UPI0036896DCA
MPSLEFRHPLKRSALYSDAKRRERDDWFLSYGMVASERHAQYRDMDWTLLAAVYCPQAQAGLFDVAVDLLAAWTLLDDSWSGVDDRVALRALRIGRMLHSLEHGFAPEADGWEKPFADIWRRLTVMAPSNLVERMHAAFQEWLHGCLEQLARQTSARPCTVGDYLAIRARDGGTRELGVLLEIAQGIRLDPADLDHPVLRRVRDADALLYVYTEDLMSLEKEMQDGQEWNVVLVLARERSLSLQEAVAQVHELHRAAVTELHAACAALVGPDTSRLVLRNRQEAMRYAQAVMDAATGLAHWGYRCPRYTEPVALTATPRTV